MASSPEELGRRLREGDRSAAAAALNVIENRAEREATRALLNRAPPPRSEASPKPTSIEMTGPPGAGKSSLLICARRGVARAPRTVAVLAVDPSSKRSGGSLLGDRARIEHDPRDDGVLIRSTAAGARLGGLAAATGRRPRPWPRRSTWWWSRRWAWASRRPMSRTCVTPLRWWCNQHPETCCSS